MRSILTCTNAPTDRLAAALSGLAAGAKVCAVAIDEHPTGSEHLQERLLAAVAKGRLGRGLLVWRSVLAVLGCLSREEAPFEPRDDLMLGVIGHVTDGFTLQRLRLRRETGRLRDLFAPERRRSADLVETSLGYAGLFAAAKEQLVALYPRQRGDWTEQSQCAAALALGAAARPELLRTEHGDFFQITPPDTLDLPDAVFPRGMAEKLGDCDLVLVETLTPESCGKHCYSAFRLHFPCRCLIYPMKSSRVGRWKPRDVTPRASLSTSISCRRFPP
ncbi:hypothetical protein ACFP8Z_01760 [Gemmobacter lanyuensis]|uniref:hypothetical protein n=1 Tax=Gemmobacter lanyuensis TaxID=1054497 RepID=UPI00361B6D4C